MTYYNSFLLKNIDLSPLGINKSENYPYFCTPAGAKIIGWAGVDGIHYIFIHGFSDMVFAVSPMNCYNDYVHPISRSFKDFLALLIAVGDASVLDQICHLTKEDFDKLAKDAKPSEKNAVAAVDALKTQCRLPIIDDPYQYVKALQSEFDYSKIRFTKDYYDLDMNPQAITDKPWEVYFNSGFYGNSTKRRKLCREIPISKSFEFMGAYHLVPAVYIGSEGIILDICIKAEKTDVQAFLDRYNAVSSAGELNRFKERELEQLNPLDICEDILLIFNSHELRSSNGYSLVFNPCIGNEEQQDIFAEAAVRHYGLDENCGWCIWRHEFMWTDKKPTQKSLDLGFSLNLRIKSRKKVYSSDVLNFNDGMAKVTNPISGAEHTITICESKRKSNDFNFNDGFLHPNFVTELNYIVTPDLPDNVMRLYDTEPSDFSRPAVSNRNKPLFLPQASMAAESICIIGGADGPTALFISSKGGQPKQHTALSSLSFDESKEVRWLAVFTDDNLTTAEITLLP